MVLSELAEEFKRLDAQRRRCGLSLGEADRYNALFEQLSEALCASEKHRKCDMRQFLRVQSEMVLIVRRPDGELRVPCLDFGGGGCAIATTAAVQDDLWLDGAILDGVRYPLHGRGVVVWASEATVGLRFAIDRPSMRDEIDRVLYRVLDRFLAAPNGYAPAPAPAPAPASAEVHAGH